MGKQIKIALAGNPNCGKTTLFNALTGSNQFVGNWPGVTVEKKEGKLKKHDDVVIMDLPGIYSLSPYTLEEVVARNYLIGERPDAILNIIDGTNLERNLYLTTQLTELGIPVVIAVNMMDVVRKNGDQINVKELSRQLGCEIVEISALKGDGVMDAAEAAVKAAKGQTKTIPMHTFSGPVEHAIAHIEEAAVHTLPEEQQRWYAIKIFERDDKVLQKLSIPADVMQHIQQDIQAAEKELDDDAESIITNERYVYIAEIIKSCYKQKNKGQLSTSDKIDKVVTNRWLGLPIFAVVMFLVYWIAMVAVGAPATDWANDGVFGDGWHLLGIGSKEYNTVNDDYDELRRQDEKEAQYIATALEIYVTGSLNVFNHRTNVNINSRIVAYDIKELGKQLKKIGMLIVQDQVWNRVTINREAHKSTRYYIDEFHLLLKEEQTAAYSIEIWKRFRKWGGIPTGITQNVKDLLASREVENIFENSDYIYMLNQAAGDRQILAKQLNISPHQLSYVTHSGEGEGLLFYGSVILPFVDRFPKDTELYRIMTTKLSETPA